MFYAIFLNTGLCCFFLQMFLAEKEEDLNVPFTADFFAMTKPTLDDHIIVDLKNSLMEFFSICIINSLYNQNPSAALSPPLCLK